MATFASLRLERAMLILLYSTTTLFLVLHRMMPMLVDHLVTQVIVRYGGEACLV